MILLLLFVFNACKEEEKTTIFIETYHKDSLHSREGHSYFDGIEISKGKYIFKRPDYGHEDSVIITIGNDYKNPPVIRKDKTFNNAVFESAPQETIKIVHDTIFQNGLYSIEKTVQELLIDYYKAGWMDASNGVIDLYNNNTLSRKNIDKIQEIDWRKIEKQVRTK